MDILFGKEKLTHELVSELIPLLVRHWDEISDPIFREGTNLEPDWAFYTRCSEREELVVYTVRSHGALVGYWFLFLSKHPHYRSATLATGDIIYIAKDARGIGRNFIHWCGEQLRGSGVNYMSCGVNAKHNFSKLLEREGFHLLEYNFVKRLN
jgi:hypothetical protein